MRDIIVTVRLSVAVADDVTMGEIMAWVGDAVGTRMDADLTAVDHGAPPPRIAYNGDPVEALAVRAA